MGVIDEQIEKAKERLNDADPREWIREAAGRTPKDLATGKELNDRRLFLQESLGDDVKAKAIFERIIAGNELQDVAYLARGARAAQAIARIAIKQPGGTLVGWGSGFLIAPEVIITNNHVLPSGEEAFRSEAQFEYEQDIDGQDLPPVIFRLQPNKLFVTDSKLDFSVVAVAPTAENAAKSLAPYGYLPLVETLGKVTEGEWLTVIQHPNGDRKQVCVRENQFIKKSDDVIWYRTDTVGGSSGSPVFNNDWYVVALHHSGVPQEVDGRIQTIDGRDLVPGEGEDRIKWVANEGIRVSRIVETLRNMAPNHPLLRPVFESRPENSRIGEFATGWRPVITPKLTLPLPKRSRQETRQMADTLNLPKTINLTLTINADGSVDAFAGRASLEASFVEAAKKKKSPAFDVPFESSYNDRKGYLEDYLGAAQQVKLPILSPAVKASTVTLLPPAANGDHVLKYHNYSLVMNKKRRLATYSAANVNFGDRYDMARPSDVWRLDSRIPTDKQLGNFYYVSNLFDRGHLTRREDLEFGSTREKALVSAADTCHYTNAAPQHAKFNQNKELWQGIERHILEGSIIAKDLKAQVITGPVFEEDDPVYEKFPDIQYPVRYWKVVAAVDDSGALFATAYILDQSAVIAEFGIEEAAPFGAYKTFQVSIAEVERLTGLRFVTNDDKPLGAHDPLHDAAVSRRRAPGKRSGFDEAVAVGAPDGYLLLDQLESIQLR